ncbi:MAG: FeoA family protein [Algisphaera sp.]
MNTSDVNAANTPLGDSPLDPHAPGCLDLESRALSSLVPGRVAVIASVDEGHEHANRLKALGLCVGRKLQVVKTGDPLIVRVLGSRLGLSARLADRVFVTPCSESHVADCAGNESTTTGKEVVS